MKRFLALLLAAALCAGIAGCSSSGTETASSASASDTSAETAEAVSSYAADEMVVGSPIEATTLDPAFNNNFGSFMVLSQICEPILSIDTEGNIQDGLASYTTEDNITYVFTFQQGILFSDGSEMTAEDAVFSLQHYIDPEVAGGSLYAYSNVVSVEQTGDYEMTVTLAAPDSTFLARVSGYYGLVFSKAQFESIGGEQFGTAEGGIIGTGAYVLDSWDMGVQTVLTKNENYRDADSVEVSKVTILYFSDISAEVMALKSGQIDAIVEFDASLTSDIDAMENVTHITADPKACILLSYNCESGPFSDYNVRMAVASALDKNALMVSQFGENGCSEATSYYGPMTTVGYGYDIIDAAAEENPQPEYDIEAAKEYLAASDYPDGFDCSIMCFGDTASANMCVAIQALLAQIGINVDVVQQTTDEAIAAGYGFTLNDDGTRVYDLFVTTWSVDVNEPLDFYDQLLTSYNIGMGGCNFSCYATDKIDSLVAQGKAALTEEEKAECVAELIRVSTEAEPYTVIGYMNANMALNNRFTFDSFSASWISNLRFADVHIAD